MSGWYFLCVGIGGAVIWTILVTRREKEKQRSLASSRVALTRDQFVGELAKLGVRAGTASFLFDEIESYYFSPLRPDPSDRVETTLKIDPEDVTDIVEKHWRNLHGSIEPANTVSIPKDPSLAELGRFLDGLSDISTEQVSRGL